MNYFTHFLYFFIIILYAEKAHLFPTKSVINYRRKLALCLHHHGGIISPAVDVEQQTLGTVRSPVADELDGLSGDFPALFLSTYWQKKPVLVRNYIPAIESQVDVSSAMLLELCQDEDVESRIIARTSGLKWKKKAGPFREADVLHLPAKNWTLLVQEADRHVPHLADLWTRFFAFVPAWRRDDVMVSYAREGGGIGAHVDNYDVFLLQARGTRRWAIEHAFLSARDEQRREVSGAQTRLLRDFSTDQAWELRAGDMLYLPPRVPHMGVSLDDACITVSMGFRAPSYTSLCAAYVEHVCSQLQSTDMYCDPDLKPQASIGNVAEEALTNLNNNLRKQLESGLSRDAGFNTWLGGYLTIPLRSRPPAYAFFLREAVDRKTGRERGDRNSADSGEEEEEEEDSEFDYDALYIRGRWRRASHRVFASVGEVLGAVAEGAVSLRRAEGVKAVYIGLELFLDGEVFVIPAEVGVLGALLCDSNDVPQQRLQTLLLTASTSPAATGLLEALLTRGFYYPVDVALQS